MAQASISLRGLAASCDKGHTKRYLLGLADVLAALEIKPAVNIILLKLAATSSQRYTE